MVDQDVKYSLICAVREGRLERARELINSFGLSYSLAWANGYVLLCDAFRYNHAEVAKLLITSGSRVNIRHRIIKPLNTPLHYAVVSGDMEIVKMILDKGANIDAKNEYGRTPLHDAIINKKIEVTELFLKHRADVDAEDKDNKTPLHVAAETGCLQIVEHLLKYGAHVNYVCSATRWKKAYAPLHLAAEKGNKEVVTLLLSSGANVDVKGEDSITPLHIAAKKGYICIAKDLLNHGACINSITLKEGYTPLHFASELHNAEAVELFLNRGADINASTEGNLTPLYIATETGHETVVTLLLQHGAKVDSQDHDSKTILHLAFEKGYLKIIEDLLKYGADVKTLNNSTLKEGFTPLHSAAKNKQEEAAKLLISYEVDINAKNKIGKSPIFYAIENADLKITKLLLTNGANIKDSPELLNIAIKKGCIEIVEALLQHDADINACDEYGRTALNYTALSETEYFECGFPSEYSYNNIRGEIAKLLLSKGAKIDSQTKDGVTTLHAAIQKGYAKVVEALLKYNANVNPGVKNYITPLHLSAQSKHEDISIMILNKGANVNAKLNDGTTALHIAAQNGLKKVVKVMLECGAKVDSKTKHDITPLHLGAQKGNQEIIETILKFGADINSKDNGGRTALHIASCLEGHDEVVGTLLEYGADINITSSKNHTPLDYAGAGIREFYRQLDNRLPVYFDPARGVSSCEVTAETLKRHIVKMKTANLYVSKENLLSMVSSDGLSDFQDECKEEITSMKGEKMYNLNTSFYDILAKGTSSLAIYMRNENIVQALKSDDYKTKFPIYASMIESNFRKGMKRKELLVQGNKIFYLLFNNFPELPYNCIEKIFSYLSDEDLIIFMDACNGI